VPDAERRSAFLKTALGGAALALVIDVLMLCAGHPNLWHQMGLLGGFYDAQGRAILHGHLSVPPGSVSFEGFVVAGRTYMYFGPVPALLRLPVLLVTHSLDGRLTQLSMLLALVVLMVSGASLHWRVRERLRPGAALGRGERVATFALAVALGTGVPLFLASWAVVYHEAELWGAAFSVAAIEAVLRVVDAPTVRRIAWAGLLAVLAINTRVAVGLGPVLALALVGVGVAARLGYRDGGALARPLRVLGGLGPAESGFRVLALVMVAVVVALGSAVALNEAKFHTAFSLPLSQQVDSHIDPNQRAYVAANHGALLRARFVPTNLLAVVRPDAVAGLRAFPFVGLPHSPPTVIGNARFNALLPTLSAFTSMPLFCVLLVLGLPALVRRPGAGPLFGPLVATGAAFVPALAFGSTATRYLADLLPFLWVGACAGLQALLASPRAGALWVRPPVRALAVIAVGFLTVAALIINGSVGIVQQRLLAATTTAAQRASFIRFQDDVDRLLSRRPHGVHHGLRLPARSVGPAGDLFVLGRCDGLYVAGFGNSWLPAERTDRAGLDQLRVSFPGRGSAGVPQALVTLGRGPRRVTVTTRRAGSRVAFAIRTAGRVVGNGAPVAVRGRSPVTVSIDAVNATWLLTVSLPGVPHAAIAAVPYHRLAPQFLGSDPSDPRLARFGGSVSRLPQRTPVCDGIARRARILGPAARG
jgi:hypothetical protein